MPNLDLTPIRFIDAQILVEFDRPSILTKKPDAPTRFDWAGVAFQILEVISQWSDYSRRGRMAKNMKPEHLATASRRGSWGVGRFYFRVRTEDRRIFDLYYDRAPVHAGDREGHWFLWRELAERVDPD